MCDRVCELVAGENRGESVTPLGTGCWREEWAECDGFWEQGVGERRGQIVSVFGNRLLDRGEGRV